jgi:hypothetical protein
VIAGLVLAMEGRIRVGDRVRVAGIEGEVITFGVRSIVVRGDDGTVHQIPNEKLLSEPGAALRRGGVAACDVVVSVPRHVATNRATETAWLAACLSPYASPRNRPDVFLAPPADAAESCRIQIRGYAFDAAYADHYRSDVIARLKDAFDVQAPESPGRIVKPVV